MADRPTIELPRGPGTAIFAGGGAWLPRTVGPPEAAGRERPETDGDEALVLWDPCRVLVATVPDQVPALLEAVEAEQRQGRYVAGYLSYEAGAAFGLTVRPLAPDALPLGWMAVYPQEHAAVIPAAVWRRHLDGIDVSPVASVLAGVRPELSVSRDEYVEAIRQVREYIAAGDTYQVNYTVRGRYRLGTAGAPEAGAGPGATSSPDAHRDGAAPIDPLDYFLALVVRQAVPYAAYFDLGDAQVISLSPEMFLRRQGNRLESRPMKGTRPRGTSHAEDVALAYELAETEKERAENLMIVDMVRNDLGRVCRAGSVRVPTLYAVEPYRTVWQMTSTVTGDVNPRASLVDIMRAVFPGASITGAPKYHTMEIIALLETEPRDVYTGAVGCFYPGSDFTTNIAIRTIIHRHGHCQLGTGSGVVWDAAAGAEYEETLAKAAFATPPPTDTWRPDPAARIHREDVCLFETILLQAVDGAATAKGVQAGDDLLDRLSPSLHLSDAAVLARYVFLDEHLARMAASAAALGFAFDREAALDVLVGLARLTPQAVAVHLELAADGAFTQSTRRAPLWGGAAVGGAAATTATTGGAAPAGGGAAAAGGAAAPAGGGAAAPDLDLAAGATRAPAAAAPVALLVSPFRTDPDDPFLRHKTTVRGFYNREYRRAVQLGCVDALFLNRLDRVTEGAISNVAARFGHRWVTPPLEDGLLPGIWRACLVSRHEAEERSLTLDELLAADEIVVGNSVRGAVSVDRVIADPVVF